MLKGSFKPKLKAFFLALLRVAAASSLLAAVVLYHDDLKRIDIQEMTAVMPSAGTAAAVVIVIYLIKSLTFVIPASVIYIAVGMSFPVPQALLVNLAGICAEVTATYFLGRLLGGSGVEKILQKTKGGKKLVGLKDKGGRSFVFLLRLSPLPLDLSSLFLGASRFPFAPYLLMSLLGVMPRVAALTAFGRGMYEYVPAKYIIAVGMAVIFAAILAKRFVKGKSPSKISAPCRKSRQK